MLMYEDFLPERLAQLRTQKGVSARDMSLSIGQANNYINNIENKKALPSMQSFFYICEYLGITPQEFFDQGTAYPEILHEFIAEAKKLGKETGSEILILHTWYYERTEQQEVTAFSTGRFSCSPLRNLKKSDIL